MPCCTCKCWDPDGSYYNYLMLCGSSVTECPDPRMDCDGPLTECHWS